MKLTSIQALIGTTIVSALMTLTASQAFAGTLHNGWNYSIDSFNDGTEGRLTGDRSKFEFYGMAYKETANQVMFAINSNLSLNGYTDRGARNGKISYGDLILNFTNTQHFNSANGNLYGLRFDQTNDTTVGIGLYKNVKTTSMAAHNRGYTWQGWHTNTIRSMGYKASYGEFDPGTSTYFNSAEAAPTNIGSGELIGAFSMMHDFSNTGLDFNHFNTKGTYTFGFAIDRSYLPTGDFIASLFAECGNDGMVVAGTLPSVVKITTESQDVPEPSVVASLATLGALVMSRRRSK